MGKSFLKWNRFISQFGSRTHQLILTADFIVLVPCNKMCCRNLHFAEGKKYQDELDLHEFLINQNLPRFSPCKQVGEMLGKVLFIKKSCKSMLFNHFFHSNHPTSFCKTVLPYSDTQYRFKSLQQNADNLVLVLA